MNFNDRQPPKSSIFDQSQPTFCGFPITFEFNNGDRKNKNGLESREIIKGKEELDKYLMESMDKLSIRDREKVVEELHGIVKTDPEDAISLEACLQEIDIRLSSIKRGTVFEKAESMDPSYVSNQGLRLMFLRGNGYDPKAAAEQMIKFFEMKQSLFGEDKLTTDITLYDLDDECKRCIETGFCQILHEKDAAGRTVVLILPGLRQKDVPVEQQVRALFYIVTSLLQESEEVQKRGVILVVYAVGRHRDSKQGAGVPKISKVLTSAPVPVAGIHLCFDDYAEYITRRAVILLAPAKIAAKIRTHYGTHLECRYALCGFGIGEGSIPISPLDAAPLLHNHMIWYEQRQKIDATRMKPAELSSIFLDLSMALEVYHAIESESDNTDADSLMPIPYNYLESESETAFEDPSTQEYDFLKLEAENIEDDLMQLSPDVFAPLSTSSMERGPSPAKKEKPRSSDILVS